MNLYILSYNNYYNRIVKQERTFEDYIQYIIYGPLMNANFIPNDGVNTEHAFGTFTSRYDGTGDYVLVVNDNNEIESRWFIIDHRRLRNGQWSVQLRRDLIVDFYREVINADMFIEKATLNIDNPLIFNEENMTVNQIKTSETLLKDGSGCPWIIGYYSKGLQTFNGTVTIENSDLYFEHIGKDIEDWEFNKPLKHFTDGNYRILAKLFQGTNLNTSQIKVSMIRDAVDQDTTAFMENLSLTHLQGFWSTFPSDQKEAVRNAFNNYGKNTLYNLSREFITAKDETSLSEEDYKLFMSYQGKVIQDEKGRVFKCYISEGANINTTINVEAGALYEAFKSIIQVANSTEEIWTGEPNYNTFKLQIIEKSYNMILEELYDAEIRYDLFENNKQNYRETIDAPWNIFAIPYGDIDIIENDGGKSTLICENKKSISMAAASAIQEQQDANIFDVQILPYCPFQEIVKDGRIEINKEDKITYTGIKQTVEGIEQNVGIIFNVVYSRFDFDLPLNINSAQTNIERKLNNTCDKWRITSPNYSNYFDFSVEKNGGIQYFNVDCEYKPFTPYIHVNPNFQNLYGNDFNDPRGLVLGGDFSINIIKDAWQSYQLQNKNFQNIFDRQIQNMELKNKIGRTQDIIGAITGTMQGATSGAIAGSSGGGTGSIIGAIAGGIASAAGGVGDIILNEKLRNENLDYTRDMFGYQLGNIQALPDTISKVSSLNNNNKLFPVLEYYTCTEVEKNAFLDKIAFNGMTVMTIGKISDYLENYWEYNNKKSKNYIKGKLIRLESINDDFHVIDSLADELNKGAYFE